MTLTSGFNAKQFSDEIIKISFFLGRVALSRVNIFCLSKQNSETQ